MSAPGIVIDRAALAAAAAGAPQLTDEQREKLRDLLPPVAKLRPRRSVSTQRAAAA